MSRSDLVDFERGSRNFRASHEERAQLLDGVAGLAEPV